jgi:ABC-type oligopeptide transport system ATPase subunit
VIFTNNNRSADLATLSEAALMPLRTEMQMIFQDPFSSLNPRMTVGDIVGEPLLIHRIGSRAQRNARVAEMLEKVGLQADHIYRYPHAFSGGQRQRIGIARALIMRPALVVADEAVSALDVSVQARVLDLLQQLQSELKLTYIFVSHDLSIVRQICNRVAVMHHGRIMEMGDAEELFNAPKHAYTRVLLSAIPYPDPDREFKPMQASDLTPEQLEPLQTSWVSDQP